MAETKRLIGSDGALMAGHFGPELSDGEVLVKNSSYRIIAIDETLSIFPTGAVVGYLYDSTEGGEILATGDICEAFVNDLICDIQSWSMDFSKAEVDVTTLCDNSKAYRASKYDDITGGLEGIMTSGLTDRAEGFLNRFVTIVNQTGADDYTVNLKDDAEIWVQLYTDFSEEPGDRTGYYFSPIVLTGFSASAGGDDAQTFSSPFRIAPSDVGVVYYAIDNPVV